MKTQLSDNRRGEIVREGVKIALAGPPNAGARISNTSKNHILFVDLLSWIGKSSLLNVLARRPAAIVSPIAGTTRYSNRMRLQQVQLIIIFLGRDIVEIRLDLCGVPCIISDTAGLRDNSNDPIELEGIRRARSVNFL